MLLLNKKTAAAVDFGNNSLVALGGRHQSGPIIKLLYAALSELKNQPAYKAHEIAVRPLRSSALQAINVDDLKDDYQNGLSLRKLATKYHIDRLTVRRLLIKDGVVIRNPGCNGGIQRRGSDGRILPGAKSNM